MRNLALLALAGLGPAYLDARWPHDIAVLEAAAAEIEDVTEHRLRALASMIAEEVAKRF